ncbi:RNA-directed DNA polymerase, eukaryota, reverse transcriptase zinc-binding domain protein, partial [Tanacetum coccineum]
LKARNLEKHVIEFFRNRIGSLICKSAVKDVELYWDGILIIVLSKFFTRQVNPYFVLSVQKATISSAFILLYMLHDSLERRDLWEELIRNYRYVNGKPWCIGGDINVTLYPNKHSSGSSVVTPDMMEFQDCLNKIEVKDICKTGLHFTWTKN